MQLVIYLIVPNLPVKALGSLRMDGTTAEQGSRHYPCSLIVPHKHPEARFNDEALRLFLIPDPYWLGRVLDGYHQ